MVGEGGVEDRVGEKERLAQVRGKSGEGTIVVRREKLHSFSHSQVPLERIIPPQWNKFQLHFFLSPTNKWEK